MGNQSIKYRVEVIIQVQSTLVQVFSCGAETKKANAVKGPTTIAQMQNPILSTSHPQSKYRSESFRLILVICIVAS